LRPSLLTLFRKIFFSNLQIQTVLLINNNLSDNKLNLKNTQMQLFLADCQFPDTENQVKAYHLFVEAWDNGEIAKSDKTDNFEMLFRVHAPGEGR